MAFRSPYCPISVEKQLAYQRAHCDRLYCDICFYGKIGCEIPSSKNFALVGSKYYFIAKDQESYPTASIACEKCRQESAKIIHRVVLEKQEIGYLLECTCGHRFVVNMYSYEYRLSKILRRPLTKHQKKTRGELSNIVPTIVATSCGTEKIMTPIQIAFQKAGIG